MSELHPQPPTTRTAPYSEPETLVGHYFRDASRHALLTEPNERKLSRRLSRCLNIVAAERGLGEDIPRTIRDVVGVIAESDLTGLHARRAYRLIRASRELLIQSNLRLAVHIARRHVTRGLPMSDVIQDGNIGLIKAVERFDPSKGFRFSTYAYWWISEEVKRCLKRGHRVVRTPDHVVDEIRALQATTLRLHRELGRTPRQSELASELEVSPSRVTELISYTGAEVSTDAPVTDEGSLSIGDSLSLGEEEAPEEALVPRDRRRILDTILAELNVREQSVLSRRFGLNRREPETLQVISDDLGISRERVRQIEKTALAKLQERYADLGERVVSGSWASGR
ncbi:sigma-70 family RNA polymerase sigma factor [Marinobacter caseinilyticus]|uniref:sigma-70 family RNA polymerase sigma factor n=1 Tax=Marinobacter caseinilyticus TaxID=2692195 RepID=UPI00140A5A51|nr:sigma-70 family RNA polymerase sigma factor [Marinobacter caseinilyticus]